MRWSETLAQVLTGAEKIAILGIGSVLCGDDAAGMELIAYLEEHAPASERLLLLGGSTAPENFIGEIRHFAPDHLFVVDAAYLDTPVGTIAVVDPADIDGIGFSTHMLPFSVMLDYLHSSCPCPTTCIGITPSNTDFGATLCREVSDAVIHLAEELLRYLV